MPTTLADLLSHSRSRGLDPPVGAPLLAIGWATVDLSRTSASFAEIRFDAAPDDTALGAFALRAEVADGALLLLEPRTEGRLAAALARIDEGPVALYMGPPADGGALTSLLSPTRSPLGGTCRLERPLHPWGPFVLYHPAMSTTEPTTRLATEADADAIAALFTDEGYPAGPSDIRERLSRFDSTFSTVRVAELGGEVVGFVAVHVMPRFEHGDRIARVLALVVDAGVRERGIGSLLMNVAESIARETGCAFIEVTAGRHRPEALHLYESVGYEAGVAAYLRKRL